MAANPPIVPSKNALQALRRLALSGPSVFLGAVGSLAGVATLNYHARQKVQLVERIIETKRTIRLVSNGRGATHVKDLCEAAERGEDFTLSAARKSGRRKLRSYSSVAVKQDIAYENHDSQPEITSPAESAVKRPPPSSSWTPFIHKGHNRAAARAHGGSRVNQINSKEPDSFSNQNHIAQTGPVDKFMHASTSAYRLTTHTVDGQSRVVPGGKSKHNTHTRCIDTHQADVFHHSPNGQVNKRQTGGLSPKPANDMVLPLPSDFQPWPIQKHEEVRRPVDAGLNVPNHARKEARPAAASHPSSGDELLSGRDLTVSKTQLVATSPSQEMPHQSLIEIKSLKGKPFPVFFPGKSSIPVAMHSHAKLQEVDRLDISKSRLVKVLGVHKYAFVATQIRKAFSLHETVGPELYSETIKRYAENGEDEDWIMVELLCLRFSRFREGQITKSELQLLRRLLANPPISESAKDILFSRFGPFDKHELEGKQHELAFHYLQDYCSDNPGADAAINELNKVLSLARAESVQPDGEILEPVVAYLCQLGNTDVAESLVIEAVSSYHLEVPTSVTTQLLCGYAESNKWRNVQRLMDRLHQEFSKPYLKATMFGHTFQHYISQKPIDQAYKYLCFAVDYWTILVIPAISAALLSACIRIQRFDLIQQWMRKSFDDEFRFRFGTESKAVAHGIGQSWRDMRASCSTVEKTCRAFSYAAVVSPFSENTIMDAEEVMAADLSGRIQSIKSLTGVKTVKGGHEVVDDLDCVFEQMMDLLSSPLVVNSDRVRVQTEVERLIRQAQAAIRVNQTITGKWHVFKAFDENVNDSVDSDIRSAPSDESGDRNSTTISRKLQQAVEAGETKTIEVLHQGYLKQQVTGQRLDHTQLKLVVRSFYRSDSRKWAAMRLLTWAYAQPYISGPQGTLFDLELFQIWLQLAHELKSTNELRRILWAILDNSSHLQLTRQFLSVVLMCTSEYTASSRTSYHDHQNPLRQEIRYLRHRLFTLQQRKNRTSSRTSTDRFVRSLSRRTFIHDEQEDPDGILVKEMPDHESMLSSGTIERFERVVEGLKGREMNR